MATPTKLLPKDIISEQPVVHPALDWRDGTLVVGVRLAEGNRAVLTSWGQILPLDQLKWPICEQGRGFSRSPIREQVAQQFMDGYGTPQSPDTAYALVATVARLSEYYRRFITFPAPWWPEVLALWTLGTYLYPIFNAYPYLRISSPEPGCGKSLLGEIISKLSFNGELLVSPTEANVFRLSEAERGTQVWDEVENEHEAEKSRLRVLKAVLLNGYRASGTVPRQERGSDGQYTTVRFHVYVPRVLIGLSDLPTVVQQRAISLTLQRRSVSEKIERYRPQEQETEERGLREMCALYALSYCSSVAKHYHRDDLTQSLESTVGQAGRLVDDLLIPLVAVAAAPIDADARSRSVILPLLRTLVSDAVPHLSVGWNEAAKATPFWLPFALDGLEQHDGITPADLADYILAASGEPISPERLAHGLHKYGLRTTKRGGARVYLATHAAIDQLRLKYGIHKPETGPPPAAAAAGQDG